LGPEFDSDVKQLSLQLSRPRP